MAKGAILVTTRNSSHIWSFFIDSFRRHCKDYELYVWDNGSREGDIEYLRTYVQEGLIKSFFQAHNNQMFTAAANGLLRMAYEDGHKQLIIVNPDIEFREDWDKDVESNKGIMGFQLVKMNGLIEHFGAFSGGEHFGRGERDEGQYTETRECDWVTFGCVAISRECFETLGLLDEDYPHFGSDREYCKLAKSKGFPVLCSPQRLWHGFGKSTKPYVFADVPEKIWMKHVEERRKSGVFFPADQSSLQRIDKPGRYMDLKTKQIVG